jgi:hypothetical protein
MFNLMLRKLTAIGALMPALAFSLFLSSGTATAGKPVIDPSYVDGKIYYMIGPHAITNPNPQLYAQAEELYLIAYPINPSGTDTDPKTLPSGYQPLCNPCYHFGPNDPGAYHDHVLTGAPGLGKNGTAGEYLAPWKMILVVYTLAAAEDPNFKPITSAVDLDAAEAACDAQPATCILQKQNQPGNPNPYEVETGVVLICPLVAPEA